MISSETPTIFEPGTIIELNELSELRLLENIIARNVDPSLDKRSCWVDSWNARPQTRDALNFQRCCHG